MKPKKVLARTLALPLAFAVTFLGGGVALAHTPESNAPIPTNQTNGTSTDHIVTPDGTATVIEDLANGTITVIDETGQKAVFDRAEILDLAAQIPTTQQDSRMATTASVGEGTRAYLCNLFAGIAAGPQDTSLPRTQHPYEPGVY